MIELLDDLQRVSLEMPNKVAFSCGQNSISYGELARRVAGATSEILELPPVIGLLAEDSIDWVIADLAISAAGKTLVPIPAFFSTEQIAHLVADAGVDHVLCDSRLRPLAGNLDKACSGIPQSEGGDIRITGGASRIIYTSGSTGTPKGVRLAGGQIAHNVRALASTSQASASDRHLSVLPFSLLLEQICGIYLVIHAGASCRIAAGAAESCAKGDISLLVQSFEEARPTTSVLVPELLSALIGGCAQLGKPVPDSLRFVAVGGARVPDHLLEAAWLAGIPACVGYGLSECCSVVTLNPPGSKRYSAGKPLPGIDVEIQDGEIVVSGPTVMSGYLGGEKPEGRWPTGDLGRFDENGDLVILGRKDNLIVTSNGRNISPEWIETLVQLDPQIGRCVVTCGDDGELATVVTLSAKANPGSLESVALAEKAITKAVAGVPDYAKPKSCLAISEGHLVAANLLNGNGEPRRLAVNQFFSDPSHARQIIDISKETNSL